MEGIRVGLIGCGAISPAYLKGVKGFPGLLEITACADLSAEAAKARATEFSIPRVLSVDELIADPKIDLVLNLTIPKAHSEVYLKALKAGKHVYGEKPLAVSRAEGLAVLEEAKRKNLMVGSAPDTFMGQGQQTARKAVDQGLIGRPIACVAFIAFHGHESWHPNPDFYYQPGGGPLLDMGVYYLTALVNCLGPVRRVSGSAATSFPERTITSAPKKGQIIKVNTATHISGTLDFENGTTGTVIASFDMWGHSMPGMEIYGSEGSLKLPDPNGFKGPVLLRKPADKEWSEIPLIPEPPVNARGMGLADMARAIREKRPARASGELAFHVLEIMDGILESSRTGRHFEPSSRPTRPEPI